MISDVQHIFMNLLSIPVSYLESIHVLCPFLNWITCYFALSYSSFYILWPKIWSSLENGPVHSAVVERNVLYMSISSIWSLMFKPTLIIL